MYWEIVVQMQKKILTYLKGNYDVIMDPLGKIKIGFIFILCLLIPVTHLLAFETRDYLLIESLVKSCYKDNKSCKVALLKIHNYQKIAAMNKNFSCQTRLLGLEANLIMAMNFNLKRNEAKSITQAVRKYC